MLMTKKRRPPIPSLRGWAISVLQGARAIRECEEHGWMRIVPTRTPASALSWQPDEIHQPTSLRTKPSLRSLTC